MSSTHEPPQLLEPINLLEPLDLKQQDVAFPGRGETAATDVRAQPHFTRDMPRAPRESARRSPLKSVLLAAGALVCFGAGTLFSQLDILTPSDVGSSPTIATANHAPRPLAEGTSKTDDPIQTEGKSAHSDSNESNAEAASKVAATPQPTTMQRLHRK